MPLSRIQAVLLVAAPLLISCSRGLYGPANCPGPAPIDAGPYLRYSSDSAVRLAGEYEVVAFDLSAGQRLPPRRALLSLAVAPDTDTHAVLRGSATWLAAGDEPDTLNNGRPFTETAEINWEGVLLVGCIRCLDAGPTRFRIVSSGRSGLWGFWEEPINESQMSLEDRVTGRALPNPAGIFCALPRKSAARRGAPSASGA